MAMTATEILGSQASPLQASGTSSSTPGEAALNDWTTAWPRPLHNAQDLPRARATLSLRNPRVVM
jgi:hypothetical protein